jgi:hypothetical protein
MRFEIAVSDEFVEPTIDAICEGARTGQVGDGKIFVVPPERAVRIRSGETDDGAVTPVHAPRRHGHPAPAVHGLRGHVLHRHRRARLRRRSSGCASTPS